MGGQHDFDFLFGKDWNVACRELKKRLAGCTEWETFDAVLTDVSPILGGFGNVDRFEATRRGQHFHATSVRIFDPQDGIWRVYWADSFGHELLPQVQGRFADGVGTFYGEERFGGRTVKLRFVWKDTAGDNPKWEQAYFGEGSQEWETNWKMNFTPR